MPLHIMASLLPPEITDCIMSLLIADIPSLKSCSLVCVAWFYASRPKLFQTITIRNKTFFNHFQFTALPPCTNYCTELVLVNAEWLFDIDGESFRELVLHFSDTLVGLSIVQTTSPSVPHLGMAMAPFYKLRGLTLDYLRIKHQTAATRFLAPVETTSSIIRLCVRHTNLQHLLGVVNSSKLFRNVTKLDLNNMKEDGFPAVAQFLAEHAEIQELSFSFAPNTSTCVSHVTEDTYIPETEAEGSIPFQYRQRYGIPTSRYMQGLQQLRDVGVRRFLDCRRAEQNTATIWAPKIFASITTSTLRRVVLTLYLERVGQVDQYGVDWGFLDDVFSCDTYRTVKSITFENLGPANLIGLQDLVSARLPKTAGRGILRFC
ncbi:hypothetical protein BJ165DRAFT_1501345 [Panaeolus papilionaceus]|nr:hypothetical protein BJ165DRAFT_1501345 [Panaeolus papilionaceus]